MSSGLDARLLLDRITKLTRENMSLKRDVVENDKRIEELEAKLCAAEASAAPTATAASPPVGALSASNTELKLLSIRVTFFEQAAVSIGQ